MGKSVACKAPRRPQMDRQRQNGFSLKQRNRKFLTRDFQAFPFANPNCSCRLRLNKASPKVLSMTPNFSHYQQERVLGRVETLTFSCLRFVCVFQLWLVPFTKLSSLKPNQHHHHQGCCQRSPLAKLSNGFPTKGEFIQQIRVKAGCSSAL